MQNLLIILRAWPNFTLLLEMSSSVGQHLETKLLSADLHTKAQFSTAAPFYFVHLIFCINVFDNANAGLSTTKCSCRPAFIANYNATNVLS